MSHNNIVFQNYLLAFVDLVGQRDSLWKMTSLPTTPNEEGQFIELAAASLGKVLKVRKAFTDFFDGARHATLDLSQFPAEHHAVIRAARQIEFKMYGLSDSIVIAVPLAGEDECCTAMNGVESALLAVCGLTIWAFAAGIAIRGGVDVGIAAQIDGNEVYGPAIAKAYQLESTVAEYPRCVVGPELLNYLDAVCAQRTRTPLGRFAKLFAASCGRMIVKDTDGRQMLDFLGTEVKDKLETCLPREVAERAYAFVSQEYETFQKVGNGKLAQRYCRLLQYFASRRNVWGLG